MSITFLPFLLVLFYLSLIMLKSFAKSKKNALRFTHDDCSYNFIWML